MKKYILNFVLLFTVLIYPVFSFHKNEYIELNLENAQNNIVELEEKVNSTYMKEVISELDSIMDAYIYSDISKNPPMQDYHIKVNIKEELAKIETSQERSFYEFYRDVRKTLNKLRDYHLNIIGKDISFGKDIINFSKYALCLPFKLNLDYKENKEDKIYIKEYPECSSYYEKDVLDFIKSHENISLDKIEGIDSFEYIQQFGKDFYEIKNPHAHFSYFIRNFHFFYLKTIPLTQKEIDSINLIFNDNKKLALNYHIIKPENIFNENEKILINKEEFIIYLEKEISNFKNKNIFDIKKEFLKSKNLYKEKIKKDAIKWDYETKNQEFKCLADEDNKLNIFYQSSFEFNNLDDGENIIYKCAKLFYSNNYRIVGIESNNLGGDGSLAYLLTQLIQPKIDVRFNMAVKQNELIKDYFNQNKNNLLEINTCLPFENWENFIEEKPDDYGNNTKHYRSKIYNFVPKININNLKQKRLEFEKQGKLKKPTDIIIFTDSISFDSTSFFIKNLQNTGGAIIAGYLGNPKISENFDASQGPSIGDSFSWSNYYTNLSKNGFELNSLTFAESFDDDYQNEGDTLIPREYKINKVDERTNIYHYFDDSSYEEFINEAKKIFKKYNEENKCNKDNLNLLLENEECSDGNAHGGYLCGESGKWTKQCEFFYCDIGYYYNHNKKECEINQCTKDIYIDINEEMKKEFEISEGNTYILAFNNNSLAYFIDSPIEDIIHYPTFEVCTKFCAVKNNSVKFMYVNYFHTVNKNITIKVTSVVNSADIFSIKVDSPKISKIRPISKKIINFIQVTEKNYFYADSYDNYAKINFGEYSEGIQITDILNTNAEYFPESHNKIMELNPDKIYVIIVNAKASYAKLYLHNEIPYSMKLLDGNKNLLYLKKGKEYEFNFESNNMPFLIKLNMVKKTTLDIGTEYGIKTTLNIDNKYYNPIIQIDQIYKGKIIINNIENDDDLIELLYSFGEKETEILNERTIENKTISKNITLVEYSLENNETNMEIYLESDDSFKIAVYAGPTIYNYFYYSPFNLPENSENSVKKYFIKLNNPLKNIGEDLKKNEKYKVK